jgi:hypothetical protein
MQNRRFLFKCARWSILRNQLKGRIRLSDGERKTLAEMG